MPYYARDVDVNITYVYARPEKDGTYYFYFSGGLASGDTRRVAYATGSSPTGPWSARVGLILQKELTQDVKGTGDHSVVQVLGTDQWYIAYHRFAIPNGDGTHRETMIDRMYFNADGSSRPVVPTLAGVRRSDRGAEHSVKRHRGGPAKGPPRFT